MKKSIYGLTPEQLTDWLVANGQKRFRADQIWDWLYKKRITNFSDMKNINKDCIDLLDTHYYIESLEQTVKQESADGTISRPTYFTLIAKHMLFLALRLKRMSKLKKPLRTQEK